MAVQPIVITEPTEWKAAIVQSLAKRNMSRYAFVRKCVDADLCSLHTAECLLADPTRATGKRIPTLENAIEIARLAGLEMRLVPVADP